MNDGLSRILRQFETNTGALDQLFNAPILLSHPGSHQTLEKGIVLLTELIKEAAEHLAVSTAFEREEFKSGVEKMAGECKTQLAQAIIQTMLSITTMVIKFKEQ